MTTGLFFSGLAVVLGILCAIFTDFSIKIIVILLGAAAFVKGIFDLIKFRSVIKDDIVFHRTVLIRSLVSIVVGIVAVALPMAFFKTAETIVHVLLFVLGIYFLFCAVGGLLIVRRMKNAELPTKVYSSSIIIYLLIAILLFLLATIGMKNILRIVGIGLAVCGAVGCVYSWHNRSQERPQELKPDAVVDVTEKPPVESSPKPDTENPSTNTDDDGDYIGE